MFLSRNKKTKVYPCKPQFYYIKVGFKGVKILSVCFHDGREKGRTFRSNCHNLNEMFSHEIRLDISLKLEVPISMICQALFLVKNKKTF